MINSEDIRKKFYEVGFDLVGFTKPLLNQEYIKDFKKRVNNNDLPPFINNDIEKILNPKILHPWAKSVIVLGLSYAGSYKNDTDGYISKYALGLDYHDVMGKMIEDGLVYLNKVSDKIKTAYYVDNAPVLEKVLAQQAGLGWIGKNTLLINKEFGSYIFLGEIFINKIVQYDNPGKNLCGECTLCINNCPTNSLSTPYYLNFRTCRSSLTQIKGILDVKKDKFIGNSIWGCDKCQEICPYNDNVPLDIHSEFSPKIKGNIVKILNYNKKNFPDEWRDSALSWRGMRTIQRNALIALVNMKGNGQKYKEVLLNKMDDSSPILRYYAYKAYLSFGFDLDLLNYKIKRDNQFDIDNIRM